MSGAAPARRLSPVIGLPVDQHLVAEGERYEILDGKVIAVPPSYEPHGDRHSKLQALLEMHVGEAYNVACDLLTRSAEVQDFAPDASVYLMARDAETGGRQLEELAFEVLGRQSRSVLARKADRLLERGVRRVFALDVARRQVLERRGGRWEALGAEAVIEDRAFSVALPVAALAEAAKVDDAAARALLAKKNPVIEERLAQSKQEGLAEGLREGEAKGLREGEARGEARGKAMALLAVLEGRGLKVSAAARRRVLACTDGAQLDAWLLRAALTPSVRALLG